MHHYTASVEDPKEAVMITVQPCDGSIEWTGNCHTGQSTTAEVPNLMGVKEGYPLLLQRRGGEWTIEAAVQIYSHGVCGRWHCMGG